MEVLGIKFAPLNVPMQRRLQTLAAASWFVTMAFGGFICLFFTLYLIIYTRFWWLTLLYVVWIYFMENDKFDRGGRRVKWVRNWTWWKYLRDYFPVSLKKINGVELDPKKHYIFCCFPHGVLPAGIFTSLSDIGGFLDLFPHHTPYPLVLEQHFRVPFFRELIYSLGACSASAKSISYLLSRSEEANVLGLLVGGAAESYYCKPGQYHLVLKNRKGFIKLALKHGASLVPVISFGETDLFSQIGDEGTILRKIQEKLRTVIGMAPLIPLGRGFFQYSFGIIPQRRPVTVVVGKPYDLEKVENPTDKQIDEAHQEFIKRLIELFENEKHKYISEPEKTTLVIH